MENQHQGYQTIVLFFILLLGFPYMVFSQETDDTNVLPEVREIIEEHAESQDEQLDYSELIDELNYLARNPINLNNAEKEDFQSFVFLNDLQVKDIFSLRKKLDKYDNLYQLQLVESMTYQDIKNLEHFIYLGPVKEKVSGKLKRSLKSGQHDIFLRYQRTLEKEKGFKPIADSVLEESPNKRYLGNPDRYYLRYNYRSRNIRWGFNAEKDPGEEFFRGYQKQGFDFYSGHLMLENVKWVDKIVLGDYNVETGQGLALWSGLSFGKSSNVLGIRKQAGGLEASTSMNEFGYLRGIGVEKKIGPFYTTIFYSNAKRDANALGMDTLDEVNRISSLQETGYHYKKSLAEDKDNVNEQMAGGNIYAQFQNLRIGATGYYFGLSASMENNSALYQKFDFQGRERAVMSLNYEYSLSNFIIFGETGYSDNQAWGTLNGMILRPGSGVYLSMLHRFYEKNFQNIKGGAFGENSSNQNEKGLYAGMKVQLNKEFTVKAYADHFRFKWLDYRVDGPSKGSEYMTELNYDPPGNWDTYVRYSYEHEKRNISAEDLIINHPVDRIREGLRFNVSWKANNWLHFNNRAEWSRMNKENKSPEDGWLIYQDILLRPEEKPYHVSFRYALYNTDSYSARLYAYEHDILYAFSIPAYAYQGFRSYLVLKYEITEKIDFWIKLARTTYTDRETVGNALTKIDEPHKTDLKMQLRMKF